jgi:phenylacetate-coenzyme A ligase PaaK-like adenylate-forming protein
MSSLNRAPSLAAWTEFAQASYRAIPSLRAALSGDLPQRFEDFPVRKSGSMDRQDLQGWEHFVHPTHAGSGFFLNSGGTTQEPRFSFYSYKDFERLVAKVAFNFQTLGIRPGDIVGNCFMGGNLWPSFLMVSRALELCGARQLPIGASVGSERVLTLLKSFKLRALFGFPSGLARHALACLRQGETFHIPLVFWAGERMGAPAQAVMRRAWGVEAFLSGTYATVDAGPIGYQTRECAEGEHFLFHEHVKLEVVEGEAVVTSMLRQAMPVIRHNLGDRVEILENRPDGTVKFKLFGRTQEAITLRGHSFHLQAVESALVDLGIALPRFQLHLEGTRAGTDERLRLRVEQNFDEERSPEQILQAFYKNCLTGEAPASLAEARSFVSVEWADYIGPPAENPGGKFPWIVDARVSG